jgi:hypothetical protein
MFSKDKLESELSDTKVEDIWNQRLYSEMVGDLFK